jgi:PilZ domain
MAAWFAKMIGALGGAAELHHSPRQVLQLAQRDRAKIALEALHPAAPNTTVLTTTIEQVREDDLVISQPVIGGLTHPLAFGEDLRLTFVNQRMHHTGVTKCLGRVKIPAGGSQTLFAYRLAMPVSLQSEDRRQHPRLDLPMSLSCEAHLYAPACDGPVLGTMVDVSMGGARIRTAMATDRIAAGQEIFLKAMLPEPVGLLDELVQVTRLEIDERTGGATIGLSFKRRIHGLAELMKAEESRQLRKAG